MLVKNLEEILAVPKANIPSFFQAYFSQYSGGLGPIYRFQGRQPTKEQDIVLIIGGVHPSEPSGSEIANWLRVELEGRSASPPSTGSPLKGDVGPAQPKQPMGPYYTTIIIPAIFRDYYQRGRDAHPVKGAKPGHIETETDAFRKVNGREQARQFPPPGFSAGWLLQHGSTNAGFFALEDNRKTNPPNNWAVHTQQLLPEIVLLMLLIDAIRPKRIASLHGKRLKLDATNIVERDPRDIAALDPIGREFNLPGIYVDPRYTFSLRERRRDPQQELDPQKFNIASEPHYPQIRGNKTPLSSRNRKLGVPDDVLCLQLAQAVQDRARTLPDPPDPRRMRPGSWSWSTYNHVLVIGNLLHSDASTVHYAAEPHGPGFSLGDWGPVDIAEDGAREYSSGRRGGAPVYTFETFGYADSGAFNLSARGFEQVLRADGNPLDPHHPPRQYDSARCLQLQTYAHALRWVFLEEYKSPAGEPVPMPAGDSSTASV